MTDKDVVELKPCPFCGSSDVHGRDDGSPFSIQCRNCCAEMPYMSLDNPQSFRWNTRAAAMPQLTGDAGALCERLDSHMGKQDVSILLADCREAKTLIEAQQATIECARLDLNHLAAKYGEQEFVAPTICKIAALSQSSGGGDATG